VGEVKPIVIIDDDEDMRSTLADLFSEEGYEVRCFTNGAEALSYLRRDADASLILLDLEMPVMDGWTFRREQERDRRLERIPVIAMSASADLGPPYPPRAAAVFSKPMDVDQLVARVAEQVRMRPS
jgi:CheY-like chemotaxis protein